MRKKRPLLVLSLIGFGSLALHAQNLPKVRSMGDAEATVLVGMNSTPSIRVLSDGSALVTDILSKRLIRIAPDMKKIDTVFDASTPAPLTYPASVSALVAGSADTTLFFDSGARGFRVIDPSGRVVRRLAIEPSLLRGVQAPTSLFAAMMDPRGRLVLATHRTNFDKPVFGVQPQAESLMVARMTLDRPGFDSVTAIMGSGQKIILTGDSTMRPRPSIMTMPVVNKGDALAFTSGGDIAVIRSADFHVDWIAPDGSRRSSPPIPWSWQEYTQPERDSLRALREGMMSSVNTRVVSSAGTVSANPPMMPMTRVIDTLPDRVPAFAPGSARGDLEGRIWVALGPRMIGPTPPGPSIYAVIDGSGQIVDRVELPPGRTIVGFGASGTVFAYAGTNPRDGLALERYRYRKP
jgi:hypothetical protein